MKNYVIAISIFLLGICIVIGSWMISRGLKTEVSAKQAVQHQLLTQSELVEYLGLSKEEIQKLTELSNGDGSYTSELPHIKIGYEFYYPKSAIDKWLLNVQVTTIPN
ncbi:helix-turn-helix domain-containing protein [Bacillus sp. AFS055030]|uniref:helix-turn-helix domain-containing protein n=1 Tax=Bacillus sp. AFS055030 TaxID=2033507 RepID=UPI000BFE45D1|nr:helix-turn-helix domain-containing protein [Bacillus sp. AFS055030]PGL68873.1 DNA-binding protein [Bacillus sp. AFS055030]